jgi:hypothetical protein
LPPIPGMASSAQPRISWHMAPAPIPESCQANRSGHKSGVGTNGRPMRPALAAGSDRERRRAGRRTCQWRRPPITPILGNGTFQLSRDFPANGAGANSLVLRGNVQANRTGKKSCSRTKGGRIMPTSGGRCPRASGPHWAVHPQLAPSTPIRSADYSKNTKRGSRNTTQDTRMVRGSIFQTGSGQRPNRYTWAFRALP